MIVDTFEEWLDSKDYYNFENDFDFTCGMSLDIAMIESMESILMGYMTKPVSYLRVLGSRKPIILVARSVMSSEVLMRSFFISHPCFLMGIIKDDSKTMFRFAAL